MIKMLTLSAASVLLAAASSPVAADDIDITAFGRSTSQPTWLTIAGPDQDGTYRAQIRLSDLVLSAETEQKALKRRVQLGVWRFCDHVVYGEEGWEPVFQPDLVATRCRRNGIESAESQMNSAIDAAARGERVVAIALNVRLSS